MSARIMRPADTTWLRLDEPTNRMTILTVLEFDGPADWDRVRAIAKEQMLDRYPRFRQRVVRSRLGRPRWVPHDDLDLDHHFPHVDLGDDPAGLPRLVGRLMGEGLDPERPLWRFHRVDGLEGERSALICCIHHCVADGISLARMLLDLCDDADDAMPHASPGARRALARVESPGDRARAVVRGAGDVVRAASKLLLTPRDPDTSLRGSVGVDKRAAWTDPIPLAAIKEVGRAVDGTVNDVLLTVLAGGLRRYLIERDGAAPDLHAMVPVYVGPPLDEPLDPDLGNHFSVVSLQLPVSVADPIRRLGVLRERMEAIKAGQEVAVGYAVLAGMGLAPPAVQDRLVRFFTARASVVMTNVPGPQRVLHLAGTPLRRILPWVPRAADVGLGVCMFSYAGDVVVGIASDASCVPEPARLVADFDAEFAALA